MSYRMDLPGMVLSAVALLCSPARGQSPASRPSVAPPAMAPAAAPATAPVPVDAPTLVTLQLRDVPVRRAFDELGLRAGVKFGPEPESDELWQKLHDKTVSVDSRDRSFWAVVLDLCRQCGLCPSSTPGGGVRLAEDTREWSVRPAVASGPALLWIHEISAVKRVILGRSPQRGGGCGIQFGLCLEPRLHPLYWKRMRIDRITDDAGKAVAVTPPDPDDRDAERPTGGTTITAVTPNPDARRIARFKGALVVVVQTASDKLEVDDITLAKGLRRKAGGLWYTITTTPIDRGYMVEYDADMPVWMGAKRLKRLVARLDSNWPPLLLDAQGRRFYATNGSQPGPWYNLNSNTHFVRGEYAKPEEAPGEAVKFVYEIPTETLEVELPFDFTDLPLP